MSSCLCVNAADVAAEISVLDAGFARIATGVNTLELDLPAGIYKIRVQVGPNVRQQMVSLDIDRTIEFDRANIPSPVPLRGRARGRRRTEEAAMEASRDPKASLGDGGSAFVFVQDQERGTDPPLEGNPAAGLSLRRWDAADGLRLDVAALADVRTGERATAGLSITAAPGLHVLAMTGSDGRTLERPLHVSAGCQTQAFLARTPSGPDTPNAAFADLERASIVISAAGSFQPNDEQDRLAELALYALTHNRKILSGGLRSILFGKFGNPMLGLIGLHLALRDEPGDAALIGALAANLTEVLGADHPDLRALALRTSHAGGAQPIEAPPMLKAGWDLIVAASTRRPDVISTETPAAALATRTLPGDPWLTWVGGPDHAQTDRELAFVDILSDYVAARAARLLARGALARTLPGRSPDRPAPPNFEFFESAGRFARSVPGFDAYAKSLDDSGRGSRAPAGRRGFEGVLDGAKSEFLHSLSVDERAELSLSLGLPGDALAALLEKVSS